MFDLINLEEMSHRHSSMHLCTFTNPHIHHSFCLSLWNPTLPPVMYPISLFVLWAFKKDFEKMLILVNIPKKAQELSQRFGKSHFKQLKPATLMVNLYEGFKKLSFLLLAFFFFCWVYLIMGVNWQSYFFAPASLFHYLVYGILHLTPYGYS